MGRASQGAELADNDLAIKSAKARIGADGLPKVAEYRIKGIERLTLRVEPTGTATFWFRHSYKGKLMREKLGRRGSNPWRSIRAKALECNAIVAEGRNPFAVSQAVAGAVTIGQLWDEWVQRFGNVSSKDRKSARTIQYYEQALNQFVWPKFKRETPAHELTTEVLADWLNQLEFKKKLSGSRVHAIRTALGTMFRFAAKRNRGGLKNPLRELGFTHKSNPRDVEPSALQIGAVWNAIEAQRAGRRSAALIERGDKAIRP